MSGSGILTNRFSLRQVFGVMTVFAITFGLWHTNSFDALIATVVALAGSSLILLKSNHYRRLLLIRSLTSLSVGLLAAGLYAAKWGDEDKHYQIGAAVMSALSCWLLMAYVSAFVLPWLRQFRSPKVP